MIAFCSFYFFDSQADYVSHLVYENSGLISILVTDKFSAFDADMLPAIELNRDVIG